MDLTFKTEVFEGPLELLLSLIEKNRINMYDIPIALLADQYLDAIAGIPADMESLSSFLVMAATLLEIKSKMLLPLPKKQAGEDEPDPRDELVRRLQEYARIKEAARLLKDMAEEGGNALCRAPDAAFFGAIGGRAGEIGVGELLDGLDAERLFAVFLDVLGRRESRTDKVRAGFGSVERDSYTVEEKIALISEMLAKTGRISLRRVFADCRCKLEKIVAFLALLELIRLGNVRLSQKTAFGEIKLETRG